MNEPYIVDWEYLRVRMREAKGGDSYRDFSLLFPSLSFSTCHKFMQCAREIDLESLLCVANVLSLDITRVFIRKPKQLNLLDRSN